MLCMFAAQAEVMQVIGDVAISAARMTRTPLSGPTCTELGESFSNTRHVAMIEAASSRHGQSNSSSRKERGRLIGVVQPPHCETKCHQDRRGQIGKAGRVCRLSTDTHHSHRLYKDEEQACRRRRSPTRHDVLQRPEDSDTVLRKISSSVIASPCIECSY